jgi:hypothetical protein
MGTLKFNPDDFVFQPLPSPDEKKTVLEYDAKNRLVLLRTKDEDGNLVYNSVFINKQINDNILNNIPDEWSNNNDRILIFAIYESGEYILEKEKMKYDFNTKSTKWVNYSCNHLTIEQAKQLYEILKAAIYLDKEVKKYKDVSEFLELSKQTYYLKQFNKKNVDFIDKLLRESDWRILPDYPEQFNNEKEMWILWRSKIRELNKTPEDFEDSLDYMIYLEELKWPIRPDQYNVKYPEHQVEYLETDDQYIKSPEFLDYTQETEYMENVIKFNEILKKYEEQGITVNATLSNLIKRYDLIKELKEFKDLKLTEEE